MVKIEVLSPSEVHFDEIVDLQRNAFREGRQSALLDGVQTADYYRWKYFRAVGTARIAQVRKDGMLVAMSAVLPQPLAAGERRIMGWQICDIATRPTATRRGYFSACLNALRETMSVGDVFFGFPNKKSIRGTIKAGWKEYATLHAYVGPTYPSSTVRLKQVDIFGERQDELARKFTSANSIALHLTASYLNDRYRSQQWPLYTTLVLDDDLEGQGFLAVRAVSIFGIRCCLIMECHSTSEKAKKRLTAEAAAWGWDNRCFVMMALASSPRCVFFPAWRMIAIPQSLSPRPLVLMGQSIGSAITENWMSQLGDWDGL